MSRRAARHFQRELDMLIDRFALEYSITFNEIIRALETSSDELIEEAAKAAEAEEADADEDDT